MRELVLATLVILDTIVIGYLLIYGVVNIVLLVISSRAVRRGLLREDFVAGGEQEHERQFLPLVSLIVPAYCEEVTIVENICSLIRLDYPRLEIVVVNDGSTDRTVQAVVEAFDMARGDVDYDPHLGSMPVRAFYRARGALPAKIQRMVLLDKHNGGKADAINAGINASQGAYVATMDADSLLEPDAVTRAILPIFQNPSEVVCCGGQVALSNGSKIKDGRLVELNVPKSWIARFQIVEYMRSFTQSRTALGQVNALLILSGVFAVFQRRALIEAGGFLTKHMRSRLGQEFCGANAETVCEDMEVVVRLHRSMMEHGRKARAECLPFPLAWTEAPEVWRHLGKQRNRWYRGLWEVLSLHRGMLFNRRYGRIGLFSLPYQLVFEALAPLLETVGYVIVPLSVIVGVVSLKAMIVFVLFALAFNLVLSAGSVFVSIRRIRVHRSRRETALLDYRGWRALVLLVFVSFLSNLGYRQFLVFWQLRGFRDFLAGRKSWDKFARRGFEGTVENPPG